MFQILPIIKCLPYYFFSEHITLNMIHDCHTKDEFCPPYCIYTKLLLILNRSADTLHEGGVDPKGTLGFELAVQKSIGV